MVTIAVEECNKVIPITIDGLLVMSDLSYNDSVVISLIREDRILENLHIGKHLNNELIFQYGLPPKWAPHALIFLPLFLSKIKLSLSLNQFVPAR